LRPSSVAAVPQDLDRVLVIAFAKSHRFTSAHELVDVLAHARRANLSLELRRRGQDLIAVSVAVGALSCHPAAA
jgi:hypothetical protein